MMQAAFIVFSWVTLVKCVEYELKITIDFVSGVATQLTNSEYISKCDMRYSSTADEFWTGLNLGRDPATYSLHFNRNGSNVPAGVSFSDDELFTQIDTIYQNAGIAKQPKIALLGTEEEERLVGVWSKYIYASSEEEEEIGISTDRWQSLFQLQDLNNFDLLGNNSYVYQSPYAQEDPSVLVLDDEYFVIGYAFKTSNNSFNDTVTTSKGTVSLYNHNETYEYNIYANVYQLDSSLGTFRKNIRTFYSLHTQGNVTKYTMIENSLNSSQFLFVYTTTYTVASVFEFSNDFETLNKIGGNDNDVDLIPSENASIFYDIISFDNENVNNEDSQNPSYFMTYGTPYGLYLTAFELNIEESSSNVSISYLLSDNNDDTDYYFEIAKINSSSDIYTDCTANIALLDWDIESLNLWQYVNLSFGNPNTSYALAVVFENETMLTHATSLYFGILGITYDFQTIYWLYEPFTIGDVTTGEYDLSFFIKQYPCMAVSPSFASIYDNNNDNNTVSLALMWNTYNSEFNELVDAIYDSVLYYQIFDLSAEVKQVIYTTNEPTIFPTSSPIFSNDSDISTTTAASKTNDKTLVFYSQVGGNIGIFLIILILTILTIITTFALVHTKLNPRWMLIFCRAADDTRWTALISFSLAMWDFASDINFSYDLYNFETKTNENNNLPVILFIFSIIFLIVPWFMNLSFLLHQTITRWRGSPVLYGWLRDYGFLMVILCMITGAANATIKLCNSKLFGMTMFEMSLHRREFVSVNKYRVFFTTCLENIPQIIIQNIFIFTYSRVTTGVILAFLSSFMSTVYAFSVFGMEVCDPANDVTLVVKFEIDNKDVKNLQQRIGYRRKVARYISAEIGLDFKMVYVEKIVKERLKTRRTITTDSNINKAEINNNINNKNLNYFSVGDKTPQSSLSPQASAESIAMQRINQSLQQHQQQQVQQQKSLSQEHLVVDVDDNQAVARTETIQKRTNKVSNLQNKFKDVPISSLRRYKIYISILKFQHASSLARRSTFIHAPFSGDDSKKQRAFKAKMSQDELIYTDQENSKEILKLFLAATANQTLCDAISAALKLEHGLQITDIELWEDIANSLEPIRHETGKNDDTSIVGEENGSNDHIVNDHDNAQAHVESQAKDVEKEEKTENVENPPVNALEQEIHDKSGDNDDQVDRDYKE